MNMIKDIDKEISGLTSQLERAFKEEKFEELIDFTLDDDLLKGNFESRLKNIKDSGLYLFEIAKDKDVSFESWVKEFEPLWGDEKYKKYFVPNIKKRRTKEHRNTTSEWIPLYIGKHKCVGKRILDHIKIELKKNQTALKLLERKNLYKRNFRVSIIKIDVQNYDIIVPIAEKIQREKIHPIVGRQ